MTGKTLATISAKPVEERADHAHDESAEGHGDHWGAVGCRGKEAVMANVRTIIEKGRLEGNGSVSAKRDSGERIEAGVVGLSYPAGPLSGTVVSVANPVMKKLVVASGYPFCRHGKIHELEIERIDEWNNGVEAVIHTLAAGEAPVVFFDSKYFCSKKHYEIGKSLRWSLAGLAYTLQKTEQTEIVLREGPMLAMERERILKEDPKANVSKIDSVTISTDGMSAYFPRSTYCDDFEFRFKIKAADSCTAFGQTFYILEGTLFEPREPVEFCLYVSLATLGSYRPKVGDNVEGVGWLQGRMMD